MAMTYTLDEIHKLLIKAEEYERLERQGRLVTLPCCLETMVYKVVPDCRRCMEGNDMDTCPKRMYKSCPKKVMPCLFSLEMTEEYGKTVFLTESEAVVASVS